MSRTIGFIIVYPITSDIIINTVSITLNTPKVIHILLIGHPLPVILQHILNIHRHVLVKTFNVTSSLLYIYIYIYIDLLTSLLIQFNF